MERRVKRLVLAVLIALGLIGGATAASATPMSSKPSTADSAAGGLRYFGYFGARMSADGGNHVPQVVGRTNLNQVNLSDRDRYAPEVLDSCAPGSCAVYTGFEMFADCDAQSSPNCHLYPDFRERWQRLAEAVRPKLDKIGAFYLLDEPYHHGAKAADVATAARTIKETFPAAKVMLTEAAYKVPGIEVPPEVDWVGFDDYCKSTGEIEPTLRTLEERTKQGQELFLFPQSAPLAACGGKPGFSTDAEIAKLQWDYLDLARKHPRVAGLMAFGLWVEGTPPERLPETTKAQEQIVAQILRH